MSKKILAIIFVVLLAAGAYFGVWAYKDSQNTPERVVHGFVQNIEAGKVARAYSRLSAELKNGREQYWQDYLAQFDAAEGEAVLSSREEIANTFNAYPPDSDPQRFVYKFRLQNKDYFLNVVTFKSQGAWIIGELTGSYKD